VEYVTSNVLGQGVFDSPSLTLVLGAKILTNFKYFKGNKIHIKVFGVIFLHNKVDKTYQQGHFQKKKKSFFFVTRGPRAWCSADYIQEGPAKDGSLD
jgi:hypothetical protein